MAGIFVFLSREMHCLVNFQLEKVMGELLCIKT